MEDDNEDGKWMFEMKKNILFGILAFVIFTIAALYISYPLLFHMADYVNGELVIAWIMNWNIHALIHGAWPFFDANIFYPFHNTLAYSDLFLTSSIVALPFFLLFHEPMLPSNITFLSSLVFLGFFTYLLVWYITKSFFASLLSGMLIIFSPVVLDKRYHLQILAIEWIPLSLLFFAHFIKAKQYRFLLFSLLCFILQTYNSFMAGYFLLFSYTGLCISYVVYDKKSIAHLFSRKVVLAFIFSLFLIIPIAIPYFQVSHEFHFVRDIRETIHLALQPEDLLVTNDMSHLKYLLWFFDAKQYPVSAEVKPGFLGGIFTLLTIFAVYNFIKNKIFRLKKGKQNILLIAFFEIGIFGLILSLGPALHIGRVTIHHPFLIPLPYAIAYYVLPGFQGIRDSSRFEMLFVLSMAVVIGIVLDSVLKKKSKFVKSIFYTMLLIGVVIEFKGPIGYEKAYTFENFPPVYAWIANHTAQNAVIAEMPIYNWDNNPFGDNREVLREYFSTIHFRKIISGGSGFSPPPWQNFAKKEFAQFPSSESVTQLQKYGAQYVIVHTDEFDALDKNGAFVIATLSHNKQLRFIIREGNAYVYKFK